jgi:hypothetical protein
MLEQSTHATPFAHHLRTWVHGLGNSRVSACLAVLGSMYMYMFGVNRPGLPYTCQSSQR